LVALFVLVNQMQLPYSIWSNRHCVMSVVLKSGGDGAIWQAGQLVLSMKCYCYNIDLEARFKEMR
jgi:hypothetical protein